SIPLSSESAWPWDPRQGCELDENDGDVWCASAYHVRRGSWARDPSVAAHMSEADRAARFRILHSEALASDKRPIDVAAVMGLLARGEDIWVAIGWNGDAWRQERFRGDVLPDYPVVGHHAVVVAGYRTGESGRQFLLHNSWSEKWGDRGYAWV